MMKQYNDISDIDTSTNTGMLLLSAMSILSGYSFCELQDEYGECVNREDILIELRDLADYVFNDKSHSPYIPITTDIDTTISSGVMLNRIIVILTTNECYNGIYGSNRNVDNIIRHISKMLIIEMRNRSIDLVIG